MQNIQQIVNSLIDKKAKENNIIDLNAYAVGAIDALEKSKYTEMLEALKTVISLRDLIDYDESIVNESNIGEASALNQMLKRIESLIKEATEI